MRFKLAIAVVGVLVAASASAQFFAPIGLKLYEASFGNSGPPRGFMLQTPAINYDIGGQGAGYNVPSPGCTGAACATGASAYRSDAVNFKTSTFGPGFPFQLGFSASPDSYNYTIKISTAGPYQITLWTSDTSSNGSWNVFIDNNLVTNVPTSNTGNFANFAPTTSSSFTATLGTHVLKLAWGSGDTSFGGSGDLVAWQGIQAGAPNISSVNMPCGNNCTFPPNTSGTIGNAQAVMSNGTFSGSWSLQIGGSDHAGTACSNGSGFTISSSGLVSYPSLPVGTYAGNCLVATQAGAGGSPFVQAVTFTATSAGITPPPGAVAAGFTTLAADYDFTLPSYTTLSSWLDCAGASSPQWWLFGFVSNKPPCSDVSIIFDSITGTNVLDLAYNPSDYPNTQGPELDSGNYPVSNFPKTFPQGAYWEVVQRVSTATEGIACSGACLMGSIFGWNASGSTPAMELDPGEMYTNNFLAAQAIDHNDGGGVNNLGGFYGPFNSSYTTVGMRMTTDGTHFGMCTYINNGSPKCGTGTWSGDQASQREYIKILAGPAPSVGVSNRIDLYIQHIRVWICPGGQTGPCNGAVLTSGP